MITGAKCFDIYRLPLLPDRFANGSRWRVAWRGGGKKRRRKTWSAALVGYIFWREAKDNGCGNNDLEEWTHGKQYDSISPFPMIRWSSTSSLNLQKYWSQRPIRAQFFSVYASRYIYASRCLSCSKSLGLDRRQKRVGPNLPVKIIPLAGKLRNAHRASFLREANQRDNREIVATAQTYDVVLPASFAEKLERKKLYLCAGSPNGNS